MPEDVPNPQEPKKDDEPKIPLTVDQAPIITEHSISIGGKKLEYTATTGMLPLKNETGEVEAGVFFVHYAKKGAAAEPSNRPLMFSFNGGPGSSSIWLHFGAVGPKRAVLNPDGSLPPPPYQLEDNAYTWLKDADLVFIDPVGTGFSRPAKASLGEKFWGVKGDIESVGEFIRLFLTRFERWASPLFLVGESYGTTRAAGLSGHLLEKGIAFSGIVLVSSILNMQTARFHKGNDLPYVLFLPTYTATAWYHKRLPKDLQGDLGKALAEAEAYASGDYVLALAKGNRLTGAERSRAIAKLSRLTGLSRDYIDQADLRIQIHRFCKELLRKEKRTVGRLDSRFKGIDPIGTGDVPEHDPSMTAIRPPYTAMFNDYVSRTLGYKTDVPYLVSAWGTRLSEKWDWGSSAEGYTDTSESLRSAFSKNPHMKVFVASGYYDLATPYFATKYTVAHMGLDPELTGNISTGEYEAGHMMYIHDASLNKLHKDVASFLKSCSK
ncbi:MAG: peptidase S10 [Armatimonadetes bacterium]|nr:peptidase S10 [Armatimonadota bacterium]